MAFASVAVLTVGPLIRNATVSGLERQNSLTVTNEKPIITGAHSQRLPIPIDGSYIGVAACSKVSSLCLAAAVTLRVLARRRSAASQGSRLERDRSKCEDFEVATDCAGSTLERNLSQCEEAEVVPGCDFLRMYSEDPGVPPTDNVVRRLSSLSESSEVEGMYYSLSAEFHRLSSHRRSDEQGALEADLKNTSVLAEWKNPTADSLDSFLVSEASTETSWAGTRQCSPDIYGEDWSTICDSPEGSKATFVHHDKAASGCMSGVLGKMLLGLESYKESAASGA